MQVPDEIRHCVAFIGYRNKAGAPQLVGTAFFVSSELDDLGLADLGAVFLVTARHVIDVIAMNGGRGVVRLNRSDGKAEWYDIPADRFLSHPRHPHQEPVDVAVAAVDIPEFLQHMAVPTKMFINDDRAKTNGMGLGDEVFVSGLFWNRQGKERNLPIVRVGNIAGMPEEPVVTKFGDIEAYLVEARSVGGLSGSPVFVHFGLTRAFGGKVQFATGTDYGVFYLLGVMQGHFDSNGLLSVDELPLDDALQRERVNMGIAIVTPISKVVDTMEREELKRHREQVADATKKQLADELPVLDSLPIQDDNEHAFTKADFEQALKKVSRKLSDEEKP